MRIGTGRTRRFRREARKRPWPNRICVAAHCLNLAHKRHWGILPKNSPLKVAALQEIDRNFFRMELVLVFCFSLTGSTPLMESSYSFVSLLRSFNFVQLICIP